MADSIFAAASTTGVGSSERIASEFMAQGNPAPATNHIAEGGIMGGFDVKTPKVGDGFIEWALTGYDPGHDLEGKHKQAPDGVCYDKHGDWMFDKSQVTIPAPASQRTVYDENYAKKEK